MSLHAGRHEQHTLDDDEVIEIRNLYESTKDWQKGISGKWTYRTLAYKYNTSAQTIMKVVTGRTYGWVKDNE